MTPPQNIDASGWDKPLDVNWDWQLGVLRRCVRDEAPGGSTGALKNAFNKKRSVKINKKETEITISVKDGPAAPYAAAINYGSGLYGPKGAKYRIPRIDNLTAKTLRFMWRGVWTFRKFVMHPGVKATHFVEHGIIKWWKRLTGKSVKSTVVRWASGKAGSTFGPTRGTLSE